MKNQIYQIFRDIENMIIVSDDIELKEFFSQFYKLVNLDDHFDYSNTLIYFDDLTSIDSSKIKCKYVWSKNELPENLKKDLKDKIIVENKDIKEEYIFNFLRDCSV